MILNDTGMRIERGGGEAPTSIEWSRLRHFYVHRFNHYELVVLVHVDARGKRRVERIFGHPEEAAFYPFVESIAKARPEADLRSLDPAVAYERLGIVRDDALVARLISVLCVGAGCAFSAEPLARLCRPSRVSLDARAPFPATARYVTFDNVRLDQTAVVWETWDGAKRVAYVALVAADEACPSRAVAALRIEGATDESLTAMARERAIRAGRRDVFSFASPDALALQSTQESHEAMQAILSTPTWANPKPAPIVRPVCQSRFTAGIPILDASLTPVSDATSAAVKVGTGLLLAVACVLFLKAKALRSQSQPMPPTAHPYR